MIPKLTIGMAVYDDFNGAYFSIQAARFYHPEVLDSVEFLIIDNAPQLQGGRLLQDRVAGGWFGKNTRYIPMPQPVGTTAPRQRVFDEARGAAVLCMDSHVMLPAGTLARLLAWYDANPTTGDLLSGPMVYDHLRGGPTHYEDVWRKEMWGIWGSAWACGCGHADALHFTPHPDLEGGLVYRSLTMAPVPVGVCPACARALPTGLPFGGFEQELTKRGYTALADQDTPFEVPGMGLGLFTCRREAWQGFNPHFRAFGGEEMYIHEKFRAAGHRCLCLPWLKWLHRFPRDRGVPYMLSKYQKVRNYVLGHQELGLDIAPVYDHFVSLEHEEPLPIHLVRVHAVSPQDVNGKSEKELEAIHKSCKIPQEQWDHLLADPVGNAAPMRNLIAKQPEGDLEEIYNKVAATPRDLDKHMPRLRALAEGRTVTEFSKRKESAIAFATTAARLVSYNTEAGSIEWLPALAPGVTIKNMRSTDVTEIEETDVLFIDSTHTKERLLAELKTFTPYVRRWVVMHDTYLHAERGEDGREGLIEAIREFILGVPDWFVAEHTTEQFGLTVIGRLPEDRPATPVVIWREGPGTELMAILKGMGITSTKSCDCNGKAIQMDKWGVAGCKENREKIIAWLVEGAPKWRWTDKLKAAALAVKTGLAFKLNWANPYPDLVDEAIRRAEAKGL
jgi:hypothetical protein